MKKWIEAARLRTLPLSVSGIITGSSYAYYQGFSNSTILILALMTTLGLQVLSNFANDYGDGIKGTDDNRKGEKRLVASGIITPAQMKKAVLITAVLTFVTALWLIYASFGRENFVYSLFFIVLGLLAIAAAIKYTVGKNAYGYSGFGDLFVFVFFGLVSVLGANFLFTKMLDWELLLPAAAVGLLSVAVLNLNNMRDMENDKLSEKNTLVVKMGLAWAKKYHIAIIILALLLFFIFCLLTEISFIFIFAVVPFFGTHLRRIYTFKNYADFDPELKKVAIGTFLLSLFFLLTLVLYNTRN